MVEGDSPTAMRNVLQWRLAGFTLLTQHFPGSWCKQAKKCENQAGNLMRTLTWATLPSPQLSLGKQRIRFSATDIYLKHKLNPRYMTSLHALHGGNVEKGMKPTWNAWLQWAFASCTDYLAEGKRYWHTLWLWRKEVLHRWQSKAGKGWTGLMQMIRVSFRGDFSLA